VEGLPVNDLPEETQLQVASIILQGTKLQLTGYRAFEQVQQAWSKSWQEELLQSEFAITWQLQLKVTGLEENLQAMLEMGNALVVSDGSFQQGHGACTWIIKGESKSNQITRFMITPRNKGDHSLFCSEAAGLYGTLLSLWYWL